MERITVGRVDDDGESPGSLRIAIRMKVRPFRAATMIVAILLFAAAAVEFGLVAENGDPTQGLLGGAWMLFFAVPAACLSFRLVWGVAGQETILICPKTLAVRRSIGPLAVSRTYHCGDDLQTPARGVRRCPRRKHPWELLCLETEQEAIVLHHQDRYVRLGRDLDKAEGVYVLTAIRIWMQER